jgi:tetratricopeptide (TPR) repeat protein
MAEELENENVQETTPTNTGFNQVFDDLPGFAEKNKKALAIGGGVLAAVIAGIIFAVFVWIPKREQKAQEDMFMAQLYFDKDSFDIALNGKAVVGAGERPVVGFKDIASKYSFTKAAKLSNLYAGICCKNLKKWDDAIKYLDKGNVSDAVLGGVRLNALGDVYTEKKDFEKGISYYEKAANFSDNEAYAPYYLLKAGMASEMQKKTDDAKKYYSEIKEKYPRSQEGQDIEKYIARVSGGK